MNDETATPHPAFSDFGTLSGKSCFPEPRNPRSMMKPISRWILGSLLLVAGCATAPQGPQAAQLIKAKDLSRYPQVVVMVQDLNCPLCATGVAGQLNMLKGVKTTTADLKAGAVTVTFEANHTLTRQDLNQAMANTGFSIKEIRTVSP
jgi:copper chaperone CopZ